MMDNRMCPVLMRRIAAWISNGGRVTNPLRSTTRKAAGKVIVGSGRGGLATRNGLHADC